MAIAQALNTADTVSRVRGYLLGLQARITETLEAVEAVEAAEGEGGASFLADAWSGRVSVTMTVSIGELAISSAALPAKTGWTAAA